MAVTAERLRPLYVVLNAEAEQAAGVEEQIDEDRTAGAVKERVRCGGGRLGGTRRRARGALT